MHLFNKEYLWWKLHVSLNFFPRKRAEHRISLNPWKCWLSQESKKPDRLGGSSKLCYRGALLGLAEQRHSLPRTPGDPAEVCRGRAWDRQLLLKPRQFPCPQRRARTCSDLIPSWKEHQGERPGKALGLPGRQRIWKAYVTAQAPLHWFPRLSYLKRKRFPKHKRLNFKNHSPVA